MQRAVDGLWKGVFTCVALRIAPPGGGLVGSTCDITCQLRRARRVRSLEALPDAQPSQPCHFAHRMYSVTEQPHMDASECLGRCIMCSIA